MFGDPKGILFATLRFRWIEKGGFYWFGEFRCSRVYDWGCKVRGYWVCIIGFDVVKFNFDKIGIREFGFSIKLHEHIVYRIFKAPKFQKAIS